MTNKTTMPEPYWYEVISEDGLKVEMHKTDEAAIDAALDMGGVVEINHLITTDQSEAYATARVRVALEEAVMILKANAEVCHSDTGIMLRANAEAIRALIPTDNTIKEQQK